MAELFHRLAALLWKKRRPAPPADPTAMQNPYRPIYGRARRVEDIGRQRSEDKK